MSLGQDKDEILDNLLVRMKGTSLAGNNLADYSCRKYQKGSESLTNEQLRGLLVVDLSRALVGWTVWDDLLSIQDIGLMFNPVFSALNQIFDLGIPTSMDLVRNLFIENSLRDIDSMIPFEDYRLILRGLISGNDAGGASSV